MKKFAGLFAMLVGALFTASLMAYAQPRLVQTIDLRTFTGLPVTIVAPPPPQPAPGFSLTGIAFNPLSNTIYVSDYATTNVYAIDSVTNTVTSAVDGARRPSRSVRMETSMPAFSPAETLCVCLSPRCWLLPRASYQR